MKQLNYRMDDARHDDLEVIREYYQKKNGLEFMSKKNALSLLLFESANMIKNTGSLNSRKEEEVC